MSESSLLLALLGAVVGAVALLVFRASPRATMVVWTLVLFFVPIWVGVSLGIVWSAITLMTIAAIAASVTDVRLGAIDVLVAVFALLVLVQLALQLSTLSASVIAVLEWLVPYVWGRLVLARVPGLDIARILAAAATVAAVLALIEFATGRNAFVALPGPGNAAEWARLQPRAGFLRAEGAFGHSIALGAALAMSTPFVLVARWRPWATALSLVVIVGAVVVTFSRIGLVALALTLALSAALLPGVRRSVRWLVVLGGAVAVGVVVPFLGAVFADAGDEAAGSADSRSGQLALLSQLRPFGSAGDWSGRMVDGVYFGEYADSIDSTLLLVGLRFGWVPLAVLALVLLAIALGALRSPNPAALAVAGQLPGLVAVALITQFGMLLWFLAGLAVAWRLRDLDEAELARPPLRLPATRPPARAGRP